MKTDVKGQQTATKTLYQLTGKYTDDMRVRQVLFLEAKFDYYFVISESNASI